MPDLQQNFEASESLLPPLSGQAFVAARRKTLEFGLSVLQSDQGLITEVFPDETSRPIKSIEPPTKVKIGMKIELR